MKLLKVLFPVLALAVAGCGGYAWKPSVPADMRTVAVPVFANESGVTELGAVVTRQVLRDVQREGTFDIAVPGDAAVEIQGRVRRADAHVVAYERSTGARNREHRFTVTAEVSFIDKKNGKVLVDNRCYRATTTFLASDDLLTGERDASGRVAEELARQITDELLALKL